MLITFATIKCKSAVVFDLQDGTNEVELTDPDAMGMLEGFDLSEIIDHFGQEKILEEIGASTAARHFNLFTDSEVEDNMKPLRDEIERLKEKF